MDSTFRQPPCLRRNTGSSFLRGDMPIPLDKTAPNAERLRPANSTKAKGKAKTRKEGIEYAKRLLAELGVVADAIKTQTDAPVNCVNFVLQVQTVDFPKLLKATGLKGIIYQRKRGEPKPESAAEDQLVTLFLAGEAAKITPTNIAAARANVDALELTHEPYQAYVMVGSGSGAILGYRLNKEDLTTVADALGLTYELKENRWIIEGVPSSTRFASLISLCGSLGWACVDLERTAGSDDARLVGAQLHRGREGR